MEINDRHQTGSGLGKEKCDPYFRALFCSKIIELINKFWSDICFCPYIAQVM